MAYIARFPWHQILSTAGDGTGTINQAGNYSVTQGNFFIQAPVGKTIVITHIHNVVAAAGNLNMADYGNITNGLTVGCEWYTIIDGVYMDRFNGFRIKQNIDYQVVSETSITSYSGVAQALQCDFDFPLGYTESFMLNPGDTFGIKINDDLSTLVKQYTSIFGRIQYQV